MTISPETTENGQVQEVLYDFDNEEWENAGKLLRPLRELDPEQQKLNKEGSEEIKEMIDIGKLN